MKAPTTFAEMLTFRRERAGLTREQVAETIGVHRSSVGAWETGKRMPAADFLIDYCAATYSIQDKIGIFPVSETDVYCAYVHVRGSRERYKRERNRKNRAKS